MNEEKMETVLIDIFFAVSPDNYEADEDTQNFIFNDVKAVRTFKDAGVMTQNNGVVISCNDGSEFQITVVKSK